MLSPILFSAAAVVILSGTALGFASYRLRNPEMEHVADGVMAVGYGLAFVADVLDGATIGASFMGLLALWYGYLWWKNRRNGRWKRAARELGEKSKARVQVLVEQMTPSPIPSPAGGAS